MRSVHGRLRRGLACSAPGLALGAVLFAFPLGRGHAAQSPAAARATVAGPAPLRSVVERALALVDYRGWRRLGYRLVAAPARPGVRAQTARAARTITIFVSPHDAPHLIAHDIAHELGHAYDDRALTPALRREYLRRRGVPRATWWPGRRFSDYRTGAGDFAEVFAACHAASPEFRSRLAPRPARPCALVAGSVG